MKLTDAEWQLMNVLWSNHPTTARELSEQLPQDNKWAYTTIKTMLTRLVTKGAVSERKRGNTSIYQPLLDRQNARRSALRTLIDQAFEGGLAPMLNFLMEDKSLNNTERKVLQEMLNKKDSAKEKKH